MDEAAGMSAGASVDEAAWSPLLERVLAVFEDAVLVTEAGPLDEPGPRIVYANAAFCAMTGYSHDEVLGRSCRFLQGPQTDPAARRALRAGLEAAQRVHVELLNYRKDGSSFWVELLVSPLRDADGTVTHFVSVQRETTSRKTAELDLQRRVHESELTGLPNRAGFEREIAEALQTTGSGPAAVVLFDIAGLRNINYTLGRKGGDELLLEVAARLGQVTGHNAVVAQLSGGEFGLLLRDATVPSIVHTCERCAGRCSPRSASSAPRSTWHSAGG